MKPKIFISYTGRDEEGKNTSERLVTLLENAGFTALRDRERLQHGDAWHEGLDAMLSECHGAIVVLSPAVTGSDWVRREATILSHRRRVQRDFLLLPILVGDSSESDFDGLGFEDLKPIQHAAVNELTQLVAPGSSLAQFRDSLASLHPELQMQAQICAALRCAEPERLLAMAAELEVEILDWASERTLSGLFARHLAAAMLTLPIGRVAAAMHRVIGDLRYERCREVLKWLACTWVPLAAARQLRQAGCTGGRCFALNNDSQWTRDMYFRRARGAWEPWPSLTVLGVHGGEDEGPLIMEALQREWRSSPVSRLQPWAQRKAVLAESGQPVFAVISPPADDITLQALIDDTCEGLSILLVDRSLRQAACDTRYPQATFLAPELPDGRDEEARERNRLAGETLKSIRDHLTSDEL